MSEELFERKMPFSLEAEQSVLGSVIIDPEKLNDIQGKLEPEDFYTSDHKAIFNAIKTLYIDRKNIDTVTLIDQLIKDGVYKSGDQGTEYVKMLVEFVPTSQNLLDYAKIVKQNSQLRTLIEACGEIMEKSYTSRGEANEILEYAQKRIYDIVDRERLSEFRHIKGILTEFYANLTLLENDPSLAKGVPSGFSGIDRLLVGFGKGDLVLIGARPGMGKTALALNIAVNAAKSTQKAVAIFSLEMSGEQLVSRLIASEGLVDSYSLRSGNLSTEERESMATAASSLSECEIFIDDSSNITVSGMRAKLRKIKNLGLVIVDYLQLMTSEKKIDNRAQEVADITRNLKLMAKEFNVPLIACAQLSRDNVKRSGSHRPQLSDLRESGSIEQDADIVMFIHNPEYYQEKEGSAQGTVKSGDINNVEIIVAKNRHGSTGTETMSWIGRYTKFYSKTGEEAVPPANAT